MKSILLFISFFFFSCSLVLDAVPGEGGADAGDGDADAIEETGEPDGKKPTPTQVLYGAGF